MQTAAVALHLGIGDPLEFIGLDRADAMVMAAVLEKAAEMRDKRDKKLADYLAGEIAGRTVPHLVKAQWQQVRALAKALASRKG